MALCNPAAIFDMSVSPHCTQSIEVAKDAVFPTRVLRRQLTVAQQRLRDMQGELELVREQEARERKRRKRKRHTVSYSLAYSVHSGRAKVMPTL